MNRVCWLSLTLALWCGTAQATPCQSECHGDIACRIAVVDCLLAAGQPRQAIDWLKPKIAAQPDEVALALLLARAYNADGNEFWAQSTLQAALDQVPQNCEIRSWLVWVHIGQGDLDLAQELLDQPGCPGSGVERARFLLLRAYLARAQGQPETAGWVAAASEAQAIHPEDERLRTTLRRATQPGWIAPLALRAELQAGYSSNALAGSPTDPGTEGDHSAMGRLDLFGRFILPTDGHLRPLVEGGLRAHGLSASSAREISYLELSIRPALTVDSGTVRLLFGYKGDLLLLAREDAARRVFAEGHRGEAELEAGPITVFLGGGRRIFEESGRTRLEVDGGLGGGTLLWERLRLMIAGVARYHDAAGDAYDLVGGTAIVVARVDLGLDLYTRLGVSAGLDYYLDSGGERGKLAFGTNAKRRDVTTRLSAGLWSPDWHGIRAGATYEFALRDSSADEPSADYGYLEHRVLLALRWRATIDPWAPEVIESASHVTLDFGLAAEHGADTGTERIQDLLRQDEAARRGSSCVD